MPISKNRKDHNKKAAKRKLEIKQRRARAEKMYADMMDQLSSKNLSMPDMINREEQMRLPGGPDQTLGGVPYGYINSNTPEQQAEQDRIISEAVITTSSTEDAEYTIIEN